MDNQTFNNAANSLPINNKIAWLKYPKLNWVYDTTRLLDFQEVSWYPFPIDGVTNTAIDSVSLDVLDLDGNDDTCVGVQLEPFPEDREHIFIKELIDIENESTKVDIIIHKGQPVEEIYYTEIYDIFTYQTKVIKSDTAPGEIELKFKSLIAWHFDKFCGIISIEYANNIMLSVQLKANDRATPLYSSEIVKKIPALYNRRHWAK